MFLSLLALSCALTLGPLSLRLVFEGGNLIEKVERVTGEKLQNYLVLFGDVRVVRRNPYIDNFSFHRAFFKAMETPEELIKLHAFFNTYTGETKLIEETQALIRKIKEKGGHPILIAGSSPGFFQDLPEILESIETCGFESGEKEFLDKEHEKGPFKCGDIIFPNGNTSANRVTVFKHLYDMCKEKGLKGVVYLESVKGLLDGSEKIAEANDLEFIGVHFQKFQKPEETSKRSPEIEGELKKFGVKIPE